MPAASAAEVVDFTGVLLRRQYRPGQKFVQLVFETADGHRLSLSRNMSLVRSLIPGEMYVVSGPERTVGGRTYVHEPSISPATDMPQHAAARPFVKRHAWKLAAVAGVLAIVTTIGVAAMTRPEAPIAKNTANTETVSMQGGQDTTVTDGAVQGASTTETPAEVPATTTIPKTSSKPKVSTPVTTPSAQPEPTPPATEPIGTPQTDSTPTTPEENAADPEPETEVQPPETINPGSTTSPDPEEDLDS